MADDQSPSVEIWPQWAQRKTAQRLRLLLIDDHVVVREGLVALLSIESDMEVVATAGSVEQGVEAHNAHRPDLVITDLTLPGSTGAEAVQALCKADPCCRVLVLSVHDSRECILAALSAGAVGYVRKDATREEILYAIRRASAGLRVTCLAVGDLLIREWLERTGLFQPAVTQELSKEERHLLRQVALGVPTWRIAEELGRGVKAVEKYRVNLMRRLNLKNAAAVTRFAIGGNLLAQNEVDRLLVGSGPGQIEAEADSEELEIAGDEATER
jgi:DNA-binding NarL/FixJ family response regulator